MRQAGRYLPEYRELRGDRDILETCKLPEQVVEITLQPLRRMELDAAIVFSDIMVPLAGIGIDVRIEPGRGPVVDSPIRGAEDLARLRPLEPNQDVPQVLEAMALLRKELTVPLIGFAGAPFTLASYLVEGGPSRNHERTKALMLGDPATWDALMRALVSIVQPHLRAQVSAGAQALQVFDSWVGALDADDYRAHVLPHMRGLFDALIDLDVPVIHFGVGTGELLPLLREAGGIASAARPTWRCRATSIPRRCWRPGRWSRPRPGVCSSAPGPVMATSSTLATACCPAPRRRRSSAWSTSST